MIPGIRCQYILKPLQWKGYAIYYQAIEDAVPQHRVIQLTGTQAISMAGAHCLVWVGFFGLLVFSFLVLGLVLVFFLSVCLFLLPEQEFKVFLNFRGCFCSLPVAQGKY